MADFWIRHGVICGVPSETVNFGNSQGIFPHDGSLHDFILPPRKGSLHLRDGKFAEIVWEEGASAQNFNENSPLQKYPSHNQNHNEGDLDASGMLVLPGGIDAHTHVNLTALGEKVCDGFERGTLAALYGGNTCILEHPSFFESGGAPFPLARMIDQYEREAEAAGCWTDYRFHLVFQPENEGWQSERLEKALRELKERGYASGKAYTTYAGRLDDEHLLRVMDLCARTGILLTVHAENHALTLWESEKFQAGRSRARVHPLCRPAECEAEAVYRLIQLSARVGNPLYIVHVSTAEAVQSIRQARRSGQKIFAETCPQYLLLDDSFYEDGGAEQFFQSISEKCAQNLSPKAVYDPRSWLMAPPLRKVEDNAALWQALAEGTLDVVATDHCAFTLKQKYRSQDICQCPGGIPGVETRIPLLYAKGVLEKRISLSRFVELVSANPARLFSLAGKGMIQEGADADIVILNPAGTTSLKTEDLHQVPDYSPFAPIFQASCPGAVCHVFLRGEQVLCNGEPVRKEGRFVGK